MFNSRFSQNPDDMIYHYMPALQLTLISTTETVIDSEIRRTFQTCNFTSIMLPTTVMANILIYGGVVLLFQNSPAAVPACFVFAAETRYALPPLNETGTSTSALQ